MPSPDAISRRRFLRAAGVAISLPFLPSLSWAEGGSDAAAEPKRMLFMSTPLGFVPNPWLLATAGAGDMTINFKPKETDGWFPNEDGPAYRMPDVHADLLPYREHLSFVKGLRNAKYRGNNHHGDDALLTCADTMADPTQSFTNTVSCDQIAARSPVFHAASVRHPCLALGIKPVLGTRSGGLSWNPNGVPIVPMRSPSAVFDLLFGVDDVPIEVRRERLRRQQSILDLTRADLGDINRMLDANDRRKLDEAVTAIRDVEIRIRDQERWMAVPKPAVPMQRPQESVVEESISAHMTTMFDLIHAAFLTDSTRVVTYQLPHCPRDVSPFGKHDLNHANGDAEKEEHHRLLDRHMSKQIAQLLRLLCDSKAGDGKPLIHHTLATYGSGCWGPIHGTYSLPVMLLGHGGGRITQGRSVSMPKSTPLANLWLTMLKATGVEVDTFGDSSGVVQELLA